LLDGYFAAEMRYVADGGAAAGADFGDMAAFLHPQIVLHQGPSVPYAGEWTGVDGLERFFSLYTQEWQALDLPHITYYESKAGLAVTLRMKAVARTTGTQVDTPLAHFFRFEDGLIREHTVFYLDPVQIARAITP